MNGWARFEPAGTGLVLVGAAFIAAAACYGVVTGAGSADGLARVSYGLAFIGGLVGLATMALVARERRNDRGVVSVRYARTGAVQCVLFSGVLVVAVPGTEMPWQGLFLGGAGIGLTGAILLVAVAVVPVRQRLGLAAPE